MMTPYIIKDIRNFKGDKEVIAAALAFYNYIDKECETFFLNTDNPTARFHTKIDLCNERLLLGLDLHTSRYSCNMHNLVNIGTKLVEYLRQTGYVVDDNSITDNIVKLKMTKECEDEYGIPKSYTRHSKSARDLENEMIIDIVMG